MAAKPSRTYDAKRLRQEVLRQDIEEINNKMSLNAAEKHRLHKMMLAHELEVAANSSMYDLFIEERMPWSEAFIKKQGAADDASSFWRRLKAALDHADSLRDEKLPSVGTRLASEPLTQFRAAKLAAESTLALGKREFEEMKVEADDFKSKSEDYTRQISRLPSSISERQRQKLIQTNNELASKQKSINRRYRDLIVAHGSLRDRSKLAYGLTRRVLRSWTSQ